MDREESKNSVQLSISRDGDLTFSGNVSEYDVALILDTWKSSQIARRPKRINPLAGQWWIEFLSRFSGLFPLVLAVMFIVFMATQCSRPQPTLEPAFQEQGWGNAY